MSSTRQELGKELRRVLRVEIRRILTLSDEERNKDYGTQGWKLLIDKYLRYTDEE